MDAIKAIALLMLLLLLTVFVSPLALADKLAANVSSGPSAPVSPDAVRPSALRMDVPRASTQAYADRSSMSMASSGVYAPASADQGRTMDIPMDSRDGLHMMTDGERPALEYKISETNAMRVRTMRRGAKVVMAWQFR